MRICDIIYETVGESQELQKIAAKIANYIASNNGEPQRFTAADVSITAQQEAIANTLARVTFTVVSKPGDTEVAEYDPNTNIVEVNWPSVQDEADEKNSTEARELTKTLVHELQHAIDDVKSRGQALNKTVATGLTTDDERFLEYLKLPQEINARFAEVLADISEQLPYIREQEQLPAIINDAFARHQINRVFATKTQDPRYRRLVSRVYQFYANRLTQAQ